LNLYDTISISCVKCEKSIGEIDYDAKVINPLCGQCANPLPEGDKILYTISYFQTQFKNKTIPPIILEAQ
jgi:hypothetical protein